MREWVDIILAIAILADLALLGASRLHTCIKLVAIQGATLAILPFLLTDGNFSSHVLVLAAATILLKGFVFPLLLQRTLREAKVPLEVEPFVGQALSIFIGLIMFAISIWLSRRLSLPMSSVSPFLVTTAFFGIFTGLFLIVARKKALTQVMGYLVMEGGIYTFGVPLAEGQPLVLELGMLLEIFVAVFVMGIAVFHIQREFDRLDMDHFTNLRDWRRS